MKIKKMRENAKVPTYANPGDSGFDFYSAIDATIAPGKTIIIPTGIAFEVPVGYELQVRARSGLSAKTMLRVANGIGTVDAPFRNEVGVILWNAGQEEISIKEGDRIAQGVICPVVRVTLVESEELSLSERGMSGFGSSGTR